MTLVARITALMVAVDPAHFSRLSPAERRRFADLLRHVAGMAEPPPKKPKAGVLASLHDGERST